MPNVQLMYAYGFGPTARRMGRALDIPITREPPAERVDYLVRWGSTARVPYRPAVRTINTRDAILANADKFKSLELMQSQGVRVPTFSRNWRDCTFPMLGRASSHAGGRDVRLYMQPMDIDQYGEASYYVQYVPKVAEHRVHVCNGRVIKVVEKRYDQGTNEYDSVVWNFGSGHRFVLTPYRPMHNAALSAVQSLGLDFGAVDCIVGYEDGELYVLEVNTAPGIDVDATTELYANELRRMLDQ